MFPDAIQDCSHYNQGLACHYTAVVTEKSENKQTSFPTPPPSPQVNPYNRKPSGDSF